MTDPYPDDPRLGNLITQISESEAKNAAPYDKAILTLSSGALALSFAFIEDLVLPAHARYNGTLYASCSLFVLAMVVSVAGFMPSAGVFPS
jgi:hypothetical protein